MAKVLSISSQVVYGHVGNSASAFVMQRMGHQVLAVPTVVLSNRPGYKAIAGQRIDPQQLHGLLDAALSNGWLSGVDAVLTGYIPTPAHAGFCKAWISRIKALNPDAIYLCDPIIGDEPAWVYIDAAAAMAIRDDLVPQADIVTPNAFELGWLSGRPVATPEDAVTASEALGRSSVLVTSVLAGPGFLANILVQPGGAAATASPRRTVQAHGTGDFFASLFLAHVLNGLPGTAALRAATAAIDLVLGLSHGRDELVLIETQGQWAKKDPPLAPLVALSGLTAAPLEW